MAKARRNVSDLTADWVTVNDRVNPAEFEAWRLYRFRLLGAAFVPRNYFVPSLLPPADTGAESAYIEALEEIHRAEGLSPPAIKSRDHPDLFTPGTA